MGTARVATGQRWNRFDYGTVVVSSEHSILTKFYLGDGRPSLAYKAGGAVADLTWTVDGNEIVNGELDLWPGGVPTGWTVSVTGAGSSVTAEATIKAAGANSMKLTTGNVSGAIASASQVRPVKSGQKRRTEIYLRGDGGAAPARVRVQNRATGKWLTSSATWSVTEQDYLSRTANSGSPNGFQSVALSYTVEDFKACGEKDLVDLAFQIRNETQNTTVYADEVFDFAAFDCATAHGLVNVPGWMPIELRSSPDNFVGTDTLEGTFTTPLATPAAYLLLGSPVFRRFSRLKFPGVPYATIECGEASITQVTQPLRQYMTPRPGASIYRNMVSATASGEIRARKMQRFKSRSRLLRYEFESQLEHDHVRELFHDRPEGQLRKVLIITDTSQPEVMLATAASSWSFEDTGFQEYITGATVELEEAPFASASS